MSEPPRVLLIGYGNPARGDDGLGPALAQAIASRKIDGVTVEDPYHLQVEDADAVAAHDVVIFADADAGAGLDAEKDADRDPDGDAPFTWRPIEPGGAPSCASWTTHGVEPAAVLALARDVFGATPPAFLLGVRGESFEAFHEELSPAARENLAAALAWLEPRLQSRETLAPLAPSLEG